MSPVRRMGVARETTTLLFAVFAASCAKRQGPGHNGEPVGTLDKSIGQYTGAQMRDFVQHLHWTGGHDRDRVCEGDPACIGPNPGKKTLVRIDAVATEDSLSTRNLPANGVVAARLQNRGALTEARYHLKPGGQYDYYLIVYRGDSTGTWRLEELAHTAAGYTLSEIGRGTFRGCNHPFVAGARADFKSCETAAGSGQMKLVPQGSDPTLTDPIWIACAMGCCTMTAT